MPKIVKKKRRRSIINLGPALLTVMLLVWTFVSIYIGSKDTTITVDIQNMNSQVASLKSENQKLTIEIQTLQNKDRIYTIAKDAGLNQNQDNVISIKDGVNNEAK